MTIGQAIEPATKKLTGKSDSPRLDSEVLLSHVLKQDRTALLINGQKTITTLQAKKFQLLISRRAHHIPIPYLTGQVEFFGLTLRVTPAVLVPRPFTELLVEEILEHLQSYTIHPTVADVGTGSGAIALAIASRFPKATILATDISRSALTVAKRNARLLGLSDHITFQKTALLKSLIIQPDLVVANLPYLTRPQLREPSIKHEPSLALYGGKQGLSFIQQLITQAKNISSITTIALEFDPSQLTDIRRLLRRWSRSVHMKNISDGRRVRGMVALR